MRTHAPASHTDFAIIPQPRLAARFPILRNAAAMQGFHWLVCLPRVCQNFCHLGSGEDVKGWSFTGSLLHRRHGQGSSLRWSSCISGNTVAGKPVLSVTAGNRVSELWYHLGQHEHVLDPIADRLSLRTILSKCDLKNKAIECMPIWRCSVQIPSIAQCEFVNGFEAVKHAQLRNSDRSRLLAAAILHQSSRNFESRGLHP